MKMQMTIKKNIFAKKKIKKRKGTERNLQNSCCQNLIAFTRDEDSACLVQ